MTTTMMMKVWLMMVVSLLCTLIISAAHQQHSMHVGEPTSTLKLSAAEKSSSGGGDGFTSARIHIHGLPRRLHNLNKYAHSVKVNVNAKLGVSHSTTTAVYVCFHRNISLGIGMCPQTQLEKLIQGSWTHTMSPFDNKLLDITSTAPSFEMLEVSIEQEFLIYRLLFLGLGILMLVMAPSLSKSVMFYYSSTMAVGVILVILMVLFQGMKLLPTGRKNSFAVVIYSSLVGVGSFMLRYIPGLFHSLEIGINDDKYALLVTLLLVTIILAGAWLGFWVVCRLLLTENGSVDSNVARFVLWSIRLFSAVMIIQSSLDPLLATAALVSGIPVSSIMRITILRFLHRLHRLAFRTVKSKHQKSRMQGSPSNDLHNESPYKAHRSEEDENLRHRTNRFTVSPYNIRAIDPSKSPLQHSADSETYFSTFHDTPERKKFSKDEWEIFTRDSTKKALEELVSSPDFSRWAAGNAERLTLTPNKGSNAERRPRPWIPWF